MRIPRPKSAFHYIYLLNVLLILAILFIATIEGIRNGEVLGVFMLTLYFIIPPFSTLLLILNIWGLIRYRHHRVIFALISCGLLLWNIYAWNIWINAPLP